MKALKPFRAKCKELGRSLDSINLVEAYPGDSSSSYVVEVEAEWAQGNSSWFAIDFLVDVLFDTVPYEMRKLVFAIKVLRDESCDGSKFEETKVFSTGPLLIHQ